MAANRGFFYRAGRGWFTLNSEGKFIALIDQHGERLRDANTPVAELKAAYTRFAQQQPAD